MDIGTGRDTASLIAFAAHEFARPGFDETPSKVGKVLNSWGETLVQLTSGIIQGDVKKTNLLHGLAEEDINIARLVAGADLSKRCFYTDNGTRKSLPAIKYPVIVLGREDVCRMLGRSFATYLHQRFIGSLQADEQDLEHVEYEEDEEDTFEEDEEDTFKENEEDDEYEEPTGSRLQSSKRQN